jgi:CDP-diacylglycerol---serine O-phosphatidyltransferase
MSPSPAACFHPANLLTYASLASGVAALAAAAYGSAAGAGSLVAVSVVCDTFDGRFARRFRRTTDERAFGAYLDSLSDAIAFGIVPAVCFALLAPPPSSPTVAAAWWLTVGLYAACAITRLGFYHLPQHGREGFVGLPVPVAALIWATALLLQPGWGGSIMLFAALAIAMVVPLRIPRPVGAGMAMFVLWPVVVMGLHGGRWLMGG